jgi:hypothetical protein
MRGHKELTPERCREEAKALRELAIQTRDSQERRELLVAAKEMDIIAAELGRAFSVLSGFDLRYS